MKVLITAFNPFNGAEINASEEVLNLLSDKINDIQIHKLVVETVAYKSINMVIREIEKIKPDFVILLGQAGNRHCITPEKVAINLNDFRIADNDGNVLKDERIYEDGENAYFSTLPVKSIVSKLNKNNIPSTISYTAGTFVCNHLMYGVLYYINKNKLDTKAGFIHIPLIYSQVQKVPNQPAMSLETVLKGIECSIEVLTEEHENIFINSGEIS